MSKSISKLVFLFLLMCGNYVFADNCRIIVRSSMCSTSTEHIIPKFSSITIIAVPSYGYQFKQWNDNNTDNPRLLTATQDSTFIAQFELVRDEPKYCTINVQADSCEQPISKQIIQNSSLTLFANPSFGYYFYKWNDGSKDNPRTLTITNDGTYIAQFVKDTTGGGLVHMHQIELSANECVTSFSKSFIEGSTLNMFAVSDVTCGKFVKWSDNDTSNPRSLLVNKDTTLTAIFEKIQFNVSVNTEDSIKGEVDVKKKE